MSDETNNAEPEEAPATAEIADDDPVLEEAPIGERRVIAIYIGASPRMFRYTDGDVIASYGDEVEVTASQAAAARYLQAPADFVHDPEVASMAAAAMPAPPAEES